MNYDREGRKIVSSVGIARNGNLPSDAGNPPYMVVEGEPREFGKNRTLRLSELS